MKINQLFTSKVDQDTLQKLLDCFDLSGLGDKKMFSKHELHAYDTVQKVSAIKSDLERFYLPCKARIYLDVMDQKKCITILKQVIRLYQHTLCAKEKNSGGKKIIYYRLESMNHPTDYVEEVSYTTPNIKNIIYFD